MSKITLSSHCDSHSMEGGRGYSGPVELPRQPGHDTKVHTHTHTHAHTHTHTHTHARTHAHTHTHTHTPYTYACLTRPLATNTHLHTWLPYSQFLLHILSPLFFRSHPNKVCLILRVTPCNPLVSYVYQMIYELLVRRSITQCNGCFHKLQICSVNV